MEIENNGVKYKVKVSGKVDPLKLQQKFEKELKKKVEIIYPKKENKEIPKKTKLEINLGCDKCVEKMQNIVTKTKGKILFYFCLSFSFLNFVFFLTKEKLVF